MTELWITKSTTDVHRLVDNKLPEGSVCTGVTMTSLDDGAAEEYVAIVNGGEVIVEAPAGESASGVADAIVAQAPPPPEPKEQPPWEPAGAQAEGAEAPMDEPMFGTEAEQYEYDDSDDDEDEEYEADEDVNAPPAPKKPKSKTKKKK